MREGAPIQTYEIGTRRKKRAGGYVLIWPSGPELWPTSRWEIVIRGELASEQWVVIAGEDKPAEELARESGSTPMEEPVPENVHQAVLRARIVLTSEPAILELASQMERLSLGVYGPRCTPNPTHGGLHRVVWGLDSIEEIMVLDVEREVGALRRLLRGGEPPSTFMGCGIAVLEDTLEEVVLL